MKGWLSEEIFGFRVERDEITRPPIKPGFRTPKPYYPVPDTHKGVLHTTQSSTIKSALAALKAKYYGPTFLVGEGRIIQTRPLGVQCSTLVDPANRLAQVQIEAVGYTGGSPDEKRHAMDSWQFVDSTFKPLAALFAFLGLHNIVPLKRAYSWPDDCKDIKGIWASEKNSRRLSGVYLDPKVVGWFGHIDAVNNHHYDPGALRWAELFMEASRLLKGQQ